MADSSYSSGDRAQMILHPTDLSEDSQLAFAHALRLAVHNKAFLSLLHVSREDSESVPWDEYPGVRETLQRWGLLEPGARRSDVEKKLGLRVEKVVGHDKSVIESIVGYLRVRPVDMIVIGTEGREGLPRWFKRSVAEPVAERANVPTLFVPLGKRGCVSLEDGRATIQNVLIPVDRTPSPDAAIERGVRAIEAFGTAESTITLLHVGDDRRFPQIDLPSDPRWKCTSVTRGGRPVDEILRTADELSADLIIMVTDGAHGFLDALRGTTTQQVVRQAPCPVLAIPSNF